MKKIALVSAGVASLLAVSLPVTPAQAIPRTFVSSAGSGTACTRAAPCLTFQLAHNATDAGGEVNCLDASEFGAVTITKSITIDCAGTLGSISGGGGNSVNINTAGVIVRLRNLTIDGLGVAGFGVSFSNGAALFVENCIIANYRGDPSSGISFSPPDGVTAKLFVSDSVISNNSVSGITIDPSGSGSARVVIDRVRAEKNNNGIKTLGGTGVTILHIRNSVSTGNALDGISVNTNSNANISSVTVDRTSLVLNGANGVLAFGPHTFVLLARSTVISNIRGLNPNSGGNIFSYQNNHLTGNVTDGAPTAILTVK